MLRLTGLGRVVFVHQMGLGSLCAWLSWWVYNIVYRGPRGCCRHGLEAWDLTFTGLFAAFAVSAFFAAATLAFPRWGRAWARQANIITAFWMSFYCAWIVWEAREALLPGAGESSIRNEALLVMAATLTTTVCAFTANWLLQHGLLWRSRNGG